MPICYSYSHFEKEYHLIQMESIGRQECGHNTILKSLFNVMIKYSVREDLLDKSRAVIKLPISL